MIFGGITQCYKVLFFYASAKFHVYKEFPEIWTVFIFVCILEHCYEQKKIKMEKLYVTA